LESVKLEKSSNGLWVCTLNRPAKLNALSRSMISELKSVFREVWQAAERLECRVFVIDSSTPKAFCVGADLHERREMNDQEVSQTLDALRVMTMALDEVSCPTIAIIEGAAFGGGLELALCCDIRVTKPGAFMGLTETRLAIIPGAGGTQRLSRLIGPARAKEYIFTGARLAAETAAQIGLVNACVDDPKAWAMSTATQILDGGPVAIRAAKQAINEGWGQSIDAGLDAERRAYELTLRTEDRLEGLRAFEEKRKPQYQGR
jgi:methylglutaconyl-CoA hydratase